MSHLDSLGVAVHWVSSPWFLSVFVNVLPWESVLRVWDVLLFEDSRTMLFRTALALIDMNGEDSKFWVSRGHYFRGTSSGLSRKLSKISPEIQ